MDYSALFSKGVNGNEIPHLNAVQLEDLDMSLRAGLSTIYPNEPSLSEPLSTDMIYEGLRNSIFQGNQPQQPSNYNDWRNNVNYTSKNNNNTNKNNNNSNNSQYENKMNNIKEPKYDNYHNIDTNNYYNNNEILVIPESLQELNSEHSQSHNYYENSSNNYSHPDMNNNSNNKNNSNNGLPTPSPSTPPSSAFAFSPQHGSVNYDMEKRRPSEQGLSLPMDYYSSHQQSQQQQQILPELDEQQSRNNNTTQFPSFYGHPSNPSDVTYQSQLPYLQQQQKSFNPSPVSSSTDDGASSTSEPMGANHINNAPLNNNNNYHQYHHNMNTQCVNNNMNYNSQPAMKPSSTTPTPPPAPWEERRQSTFLTLIRGFNKPPEQRVKSGSDVKKPIKLHLLRVHLDRFHLQMVDPASLRVVCFVEGERDSGQTIAAAAAEDPSLPGGGNDGPQQPRRRRRGKPKGKPGSEAASLCDEIDETRLEAVPVGSDTQYIARFDQIVLKYSSHRYGALNLRFVLMDSAGNMHDEIRTASFKTITNKGEYTMNKRSQRREQASHAVRVDPNVGVIEGGQWVEVVGYFRPAAVRERVEVYFQSSDLTEHSPVIARVTSGAILCQTPPVPHPASVHVNVSLDTEGFIKSNATFTFVDRHSPDGERLLIRDGLPPPRSLPGHGSPASHQSPASGTSSPGYGSSEPAPPPSGSGHQWSLRRSVHALLAGGTDIWGQTLVHHAAMLGCYRLLEGLLAAPHIFDVDAVDHFGRNALFCAVSANRSATVGMLLRGGSGGSGDWTVTDAHGWNVLHAAAASQAEDALRMTVAYALHTDTMDRMHARQLLHGFEAENDAGETPSMVAMRLEREEEERREQPMEVESTPSHGINTSSSSSQVQSTSNQEEKSSISKQQQQQQQQQSLFSSNSKSSSSSSSSNPHHRINIVLSSLRTACQDAAAEIALRVHPGSVFTRAKPGADPVAVPHASRLVVGEHRIELHYTTPIHNNNNTDNNNQEKRLSFSRDRLKSVLGGSSQLELSTEDGAIAEEVWDATTLQWMEVRRSHAMHITVEPYRWGSTDNNNNNNNYNNNNIDDNDNDHLDHEERLGNVAALLRQQQRRRTHTRTPSKEGWDSSTLSKFRHPLKSISRRISGATGGSSGDLDENDL